MLGRPSASARCRSAWRSKWTQSSRSRNGASARNIRGVATPSPSRLQTLLRNDAGRQTAVLYGAQLLSMALNFGFTIIVGRAMSQEDYGVYSVCFFSVVLFLSYLFEFGVFGAGARLLAIAPDREEERR